MQKKNSFIFLLIFLFFIPFSCCSILTASDVNHKKPSTFLKDRISKLDKRYPSFLLALRMLNKRNAKIIVETGTARGGDKDFQGDGGSTIIFGNWAYQNHAIFYSVDINPNAIESAKKATQKYSENIEFYCYDSIKFLENFAYPIDFLYLDSFDFDFNNPSPSQEHHLKEIIAAIHALHENSVVMVDDCDLPFGGKGKLVIEFLLEHGWKIVYQGYQTILIQN